MSLALDEKNHLSVQREKLFKNSLVFMLFSVFALFFSFNVELFARDL